jgi:hypothetical protein
MSLERRRHAVDKSAMTRACQPSMFCLCVAVAAVVVGCGGPQSPEKVVRAWNDALASGDNVAAANLFATNAKVVAGDSIRILHDRGEAVSFNAGLPCSGRILKLKAKGSQLIATLALTDRSSHRCRGIDERASIAFRVRGGRIIALDQIGA